MKTIHPITYPRTERGAALVVSMMMLIAITLVGMAAMGNSRLEWLMASNTNFQTSTLARAERTLANTAENQLVNLVCTNIFPLRNCNARNFPNWATVDAFFNNVNGDALPINTNLGDVSAWNGLPSNNALDSSGAVIGRYVIVYRGCVYTPPNVGTGPNCGQLPIDMTPFTDTYEIWALSTDEKGTARIVRSTFVTVTHPGLSATSVTACGETLSPPESGLPPPSTKCRIGYSEMTG